MTNHKRLKRTALVAGLTLLATILFTTHLLFAQADVRPSGHQESHSHAGHEHGTKAEAPELHDGHDHDGHDHVGHDPGDHDDPIELTPAQMRQMEVEMATAGPGTLGVQVTLPGEIRLNEDRVAHIVPRIRSVVKEVWVQLGDRVEAGQVLAMLESRELAMAKAEYLAALQRQSLADDVFKREKRLHESKVSAEADYLLARQQRAERGIEVSAALQKLLALGLSEKRVSELPEEAQADLRSYPLTAPYAGTIIEKHLVQGEVVDDRAPVFVLADLSTVWIDLNAYQRDVPVLRTGQHVTIYGDGLVPADATLSYVAPLAREDHRTLQVRAVLPNPHNRYRPGLFVNGRVTIEDRQVEVLVPAEAVLNVDGKDSVFIQEGNGFVAVSVSVGLSDGRSVEIVSGLRPGQRYVARGSFALKAAKVTSGIDSHAGHGH